MRLSFDDIASQFDSQRGLPRQALKAWVDSIEELAGGKPLRVIEPGVGTGRIALPLAALGHDVTGTDVSTEMLDVCEESARNIGAPISLLQADATELPFPDHEFDLGLIAQLLYLVPDWTTVLDELARIVRPGGCVIHLSEPTTESDALKEWSSTWRKMVEATGYRHTPLTPTDEEVHGEFLRRWPDVEQRALASWSFGQTVGEAMESYADDIRPLYGSVPNADLNSAVSNFLSWAKDEYPDPGTLLDGTVTLSVLIAHT